MDGREAREPHREGGGAGPAVGWLIPAVVLHGLVYFFLLPLWMGEDEPWHFEYARNLALANGEASSEPQAGLTFSQARIRNRTQAAPEDVVETQSLIVDSMRRNQFWRRVDFAGWEHGGTTLDHFVRGHTEANQPILYYAVCSVGLRLFGIQDVERQLWFLRGLSFLCYLAVLFFTYALARLVTKEGWVAATAVLVAAWLPMHARQSGLVSNDVLVKVFSAATLWLTGLILVGRAGRVKIGAMILCAGLALGTKATAIGVAGPLCLLIAVHFRKRGGSLRSGLIAGAVAGGLLALGAVLYWQITGSSVLPDPENALRQLRYTWKHFFPETTRTFIGAFNWYTRSLPAAMYTAVVAAILVGLVGSLVAATRGPMRLHKGVVALCWLAVVFQLMAMMLKAFAAGRFLFPMLPAIGTLIAVGWIAPLPASWRPRSARILIAGLILYDGFALWTGLFPSQYLEWGS